MLHDWCWQQCLDGATVSPWMLLLGVGSDGSSGVGLQQAALLLLFAAVSPAGEPSAWGPQYGTLAPVSSSHGSFNALCSICHITKDPLESSNTRCWPFLCCILWHWLQTCDLTNPCASALPVARRVPPAWPTDSLYHPSYSMRHCCQSIAACSCRRVAIQGLPADSAAAAAGQHRCRRCCRRPVCLDPLRLPAVLLVLCVRRCLWVAGSAIRQCVAGSSATCRFQCNRCCDCAAAA